MNIETINDAIKTAMKNQDKFELDVLRLLKSALQNEKIAKNHELSEEEVIAVIKKQVKIRKDSLKEYQEYGRHDLADNLEKEIEILSRYLPEELSEEEIMKVIDEVFNKLNPTSIKDMGGVMKELNALLSTKADMSIVSKIVRDKLN